MNCRSYYFLVFACPFQPLTSCSSRPASIPLSPLWGNNQKQHDTLIIFLPGVRDSNQDFIDKGLFSRLQQSGIEADMVVADLHHAYLENNTTVERLHKDIIVPAQDHGYKNIWLFGMAGAVDILHYNVAG